MKVIFEDFPGGGLYIIHPFAYFKEHLFCDLRHRRDHIRVVPL